MTDQQNPFSTMPEPPAAPDPAQAFDNAQGQAAQSYDADQTAQQAYDPYQAQAQQPYGAGQGYDPYQAQQAYQQCCLHLSDILSNLRRCIQCRLKLFLILQCILCPLCDLFAGCCRLLGCIRRLIRILDRL